MTDKEPAYDIELPPLPKGDIAADTCPVMWVHSAEQAQAYARAAVEADRKCRSMPDETVERLVVAFLQQTDRVWALEKAGEKALQALTIAHLWLDTDGRYDMYSINDAIKDLDEVLK